MERVDQQALALQPRQRGAGVIARDAEPSLDLVVERSRVPGRYAPPRISSRSASTATSAGLDRSSGRSFMSHSGKR